MTLESDPQLLSADRELTSLFVTPKKRETRLCRGATALVKGHPKVTRKRLSKWLLRTELGRRACCENSLPTRTAEFANFNCSSIG